MPPKICPSGKILNPNTGRCVDKNGKLGKTLEIANTTTKQCPPGKILNPKTGRCVDRNGKIGKALLAVEAVEAVTPVTASTKTATKTPTPPEESKKTKLLKDLKLHCNNDADPISMDNFEDMTVEQLEHLVTIGKGPKKNCYVLENIYEVYKNAILAKKEPKDPMDPSYKLTEEDIKQINKKMKQINPKHKSPKYVSPKPYPPGYSLDIQLSPVYMNYFTIKVMFHNNVKYDLGIVPGWIETTHTGSADWTTGVLLSNVRELWEKKKFMVDVKSCCNIQLRKNITYWQGPTWKKRFIDLCDEAKAKLEE